jgi:GGDEF domain-containing protein
VFGLVSVLRITLVVLFAHLSALSERMARSALTDSLTGLCNRRAIEECLIRAAAHARRRGEPMSVLMIDLDRFKQTNDRHGHAAGDRVLCAVAACMRDELRAEEIPGRWGGTSSSSCFPPPTSAKREPSPRACRQPRPASSSVTSAFPTASA